VLAKSIGKTTAYAYDDSERLTGVRSAASSRILVPSIDLRARI
jgi:hypothetical protein